jgi:hypothetical protein
MATQARNLSDGNPDGTILGQSTSDKIGFFGSDPVALPSGGTQQQVLPATSGHVITFAANGGALSQTGANTAANQVITATGMLSTDFIVGVCRPNAHQANLGVGAAYLAAANGADTQFLTSNGAVTTTANQAYSVTALRGFNVVTANLVPSAVVTKTASEQIFTIGSANAAVTAHVNTAGQIDYYSVSNQGNGQLAVPPTIDITPDAANGYGGVGATAKAVVANGYLVGVIPTGFGSGYANYANGNAALSVAITGGPVVVPGQVVVVSKAAYQANLVIGACRVVDVNKIAIPYGVVGAANITPTANEAYKILAISPMASVSPIIKIAANIANFGSVTANQTNKLDATVVGISASDMLVSVNPQVATANSVISQGWCSAANTIEIIYSSSGNLTVAPANGVFLFNVLQSVQQPPCQIIPVTITPGNLAANTANECIATLPANITIAANSTVVVNPQVALTTNVIAVGARANSTTTIGINIMNIGTGNLTLGSIPFLAAVFNTPIPTIGANLIEGYTAIPVAPSIAQSIDQGNEFQRSLQVLGLIKGA